MKKLFGMLAISVALHIALFAIITPAPAYAADIYKETITSAAGASAASTQLRDNFRYSLQCSSDSYIIVCATSSCTATSTGIKILADKIYDVFMPGGIRYIAELPVSGAANTCKVYEARLGKGE